MATKLTNLGLQFPDNSVQQTAASGGDVKENLVIKTVTPNVVTNDPVALRDDGYVEKIVGASQAFDVGSESALRSSTAAQTYDLGGQHRTAYDPDQDKVIVFYTNTSEYPVYKIGTPNSGDSLPSFGSEVVFISSVNALHYSICYDTTANKLLIAYINHNGSNWYLYIALATVNSNNTLTVNDTETVSLPHAVGTYLGTTSIVHDVNSGRNVWGVETSLQNLYVGCATPSGNSLLIGSSHEIGGSSTNNQNIKLLYSPSIGKTIALWVDDVSTNYGTGKSAVLEISSSNNGTITSNSPTIFQSATGWSVSMYRVYNGGSKWNGWGVADDGSSNIVSVYRYYYGYAIAAGSISSTSVSWTQPPQTGHTIPYSDVGLTSFSGSSTTYAVTGAWRDAGVSVDVIYDESINRFCLAYDTYYSHIFDGSSTSYDGAIAMSFEANSGVVTLKNMDRLLPRYSGIPPGMGIKMLYLSTTGYIFAFGWTHTGNKVPYCVMYRNDGIETNASDFVGAAAESGSGGSTIGVVLRGSTYTGGSGLTMGGTYYLNYDATVTTNVTTYQKMIAISSTDLLIL